MKQKELRIALVCYGGVSLAVYMHGVTKELWHLARASRDYHAKGPQREGVTAVYRALLQEIEADCGVKLRVLPDILSGASAGGINAVFLAQAIYSGQSLEPLTEMWLEVADIDELVDPDARPMWRFAKIWAQPLAWWLMRKPGSAVSESVAPEARAEVSRKVSSLVRGRWFRPPFSGARFSALLHKALMAMQDTKRELPLLPPEHPLDLTVTATDFYGHAEMLRLHSPATIEETEHRVSIGFSAKAPTTSTAAFVDPLTLVFAARATASFPGAFPALRVEEIDDLAERLQLIWPTRESFLKELFEDQPLDAIVTNTSLIDGSVLVNAPFSSAMAGLAIRPVHREVDRRIVYIDPRPDRIGSMNDARRSQPVGFFAAIFGSLSTIPREQPIRDNLEMLEEQSREAERTRYIVRALRPDVERTVEALFGRTLFFDRPTPRRLQAWRAKAQQAAAVQAGYAFQSYAQAKFSGIMRRLAALVQQAAPQLPLADPRPIEKALRVELVARGLISSTNVSDDGDAEAIAFFRTYDIRFRIRRLRLLARRLSREWENDHEISEEALGRARAAIFETLTLYLMRDSAADLGTDFKAAAANVLHDAGAVLDILAQQRQLAAVDTIAEEILAKALEEMPKTLRRRMLLAYLGFPFYDVATYSLQRNEMFSEYDPVKVDRISPDDAKTIRQGGTRATLRGIEFYNFGAFFSRAYRENDYLWGRLHGAERMIDIVCSATDVSPSVAVQRAFKRRAFLAILDEEDERLTADRGLVATLRAEVLRATAD